MISANTLDIQSLLRSNRTAETGNPTPQRVEGNPQKASNDDDRAVRVESRFVSAGLADIDANNVSRNTLAKVVREVDTTMENMEHYIDDMKKHLMAIVKNYPPFPLNSEDRANLLRSFVSIRKVIEHLTYPPDHTHNTTIEATHREKIDTPDESLRKRHDEERL